MQRHANRTTTLLQGKASKERKSLRTARATNHLAVSVHPSSEGPNDTWSSRQNKHPLGAPGRIPGNLDASIDLLVPRKPHTRKLCTTRVALCCGVPVRASAVGPLNKSWHHTTAAHGQSSAARKHPFSMVRGTVCDSDESCRG